MINIARLFSISLLLFACNGAPQKPATTPAHGDSVKDITEIQAVLDSQVAAWNRGDIYGFMLGYWHSDSLRFITKKGIRYGYDSVQANYLRHYSSKEKMGFLSFDEVENHLISEDEKTRNVTGKWKISGKDSADGRFSLIFRKVKSEWKITVDHTW